MATATDIAWAAGFLDGEGCFLAWRKPHERRDGTVVDLWTPRVSASQVVAAPLERIQAMFGGVVSERRARTVSGRRSFEWRLTGATPLCAALPVLIPYLMVKREQAEVVLRLAQRVVPQTARRPRLDDAEVAVRAGFAGELTHLRRVA